MSRPRGEIRPDGECGAALLRGPDDACGAALQRDPDDACGAALQGCETHARTQAYYDRHAEQYHAATAHLDARALYDPFLKELAPGARILDAGCGSGRDTRAFAGLGYRVTAVDASPALARRATAFTGQPCIVLPFEELSFERAFDGIWACASLLHVSKRHVPDVMRRFLRALVPGGVLYLSLREGEGERVEEDGRFFNYYTASTFRDAIGGLPAFREIAHWATADLRPQSTADYRWLNFLLRNASPASSVIDI